MPFKFNADSGFFGALQGRFDSDGDEEKMAAADYLDITSDKHRTLYVSGIPGCALTPKILLPRLHKAPLEIKKATWVYCLCSITVFIKLVTVNLPQAMVAVRSGSKNIHGGKLSNRQYRLHVKE